MHGGRVLVPCSIVFYGDRGTLLDSHGAPIFHSMVPFAIAGSFLFSQMILQNAVT
jgi:hypothetical protein